MPPTGTLTRSVMNRWENETVRAGCTCQAQASDVPRVDGPLAAVEPRSPRGVFAVSRAGIHGAAAFRFPRRGVDPASRIKMCCHSYTSTERAARSRGFRRNTARRHDPAGSVADRRRGGFSFCFNDLSLFSRERAAETVSAWQQKVTLRGPAGSREIQFPFLFQSLAAHGTGVALRE